MANAPWRRLSPMTLEADGLVWQLQREVGEGHALHGAVVRAVGRRADNDDVLFVLEDGSERVVLVHLTWSAEPSPDPSVPEVAWYDSLRAWAAEGVAFEA